MAAMRPPVRDLDQGSVARSELEHDPENACPALDAGWVPVFGTRSCSEKKLERDDDSNESHHALTPDADAPEVWPELDDLLEKSEQLRELLTRLSALLMGNVVDEPQADPVDAL